MPLATLVPYPPSPHPSVGTATPYKEHFNGNDCQSTAPLYNKGHFTYTEGKKGKILREKSRLPGNESRNRTLP